MTADGASEPTAPSPPPPSGARAIHRPPFLPRLAGLLAAPPVSFAEAWVWLFKLLDRANVIFSLKTFLAALAALFISMELDLEQPGWAAVTVYIVSQPLAGMVVSKSLARVAGTVTASIMAVVLVSLFYDAREVLVLALALWIGACLYVSVMLREAPAAYGAMLAGYTTAMIAFPAAIAPETVFDVATTRSIEILLGVILATLMSSIVLPRSTARVFRAAVAGALADMRRCIVATLRDRDNDTRGLAALRKLIADTVALESLRIHASRDARDGLLKSNLVRALQGRLLSLSSLLLSIHDRAAEFREKRPAEAAALEPLFERVVQRVELLGGKSAPKPSGGAAAGSLTSELLARLPDFEAMRRDPELVVEYNLVLRLIDMLAQWQEVNRLNALLFADEGDLRVRAANIPVPPPEDTRIKQYRDHTLALVSALGAFTSIVIVSAFWICSGWPDGASAAMFAGIISCIVATRDNPVRAALGQLYGSVGAMACAALMYFTLPLSNTFGWLALVLAVFLIPLDAISVVPRLAVVTAPLAINTVAFVSLKNSMPFDFGSFLNTNTALLTGIAAGVIGYRLFRPINAEWPVRRLTRGMMRDLAQTSAPGGGEPRGQFESRMLDFINAIIGRLRMDRAGDREHFQGTLTVLRAGLNNLMLQQALPAMPPRLAAATREALDAFSAHARQLARTPFLKSRGPRADLLPKFDSAIRAALEAGPDSHPDALTTLVALRAIRATLEKHARFYGIK